MLDYELISALSVISPESEPEKPVMKDMIDKNSIYTELNQGLKDERGGALLSNLEKNLPLISEAGGLRGIAENLSGKHVVIIGAGPSLDKNIPYLKRYSGRLDFVYIASDMALRPLVMSGIEPAYVITCETTPSDFFSGLDTARMHLLAFSCSSSCNLRKWSGEISFYNWMIEEKPFSDLWDMAGRGLGSVATASIVTTQAVSIVLGCEVASAALVANDMGFYDRFYAAGTVSGNKRDLAVNRFNPLVNNEINTARRGRSYEIKRKKRIFYTNPQFLAAKLWLEELFVKKPYPVVDCSEPGCSEGTVTKMELKDYFGSTDRKRRGRR